MIFSFRRKLFAEDGQGLVEYSLIILLLGLVVIVGLRVFGLSLTETYNLIIARLPFSS